MTKKLISIIFSFSVLIINAGFAGASGISIVNDKNVVYVNDTLVSTVYINTSGKSINSADGTINFPSTELQALSVSTYDSIFSLWVEPPAFSNTSGTLTFSGGIPNPGYNGVQGKVLQVTFKALKTGTPSISFSSASVRQNDGLGTDISETKTGSTVTITTAPVNNLAPITPSPVVTPAPVTYGTTPAAPTVSSSDLPNPEDWYSARSGTFAWKLPSGTTATQLLLGRYPDSTPTVNYYPAISKKTLTNLEDGTWYLHVRLANSYGFGKSTHHKIKIDHTAPSELTIDPVADTESVTINAADSLSGISKIEVYSGIDLIKEFNGTEEKNLSVTFDLDGLSSGEHTIKAKAYDRAGNTTEKETIVNIKSKIPPTIDNYSELIESGQVVSISGSVGDRDDVAKSILHLTRDNGDETKFELHPDNESNFVFLSQPIEYAGMLVAYVESFQDTEGLISLKSEKVNIAISKPKIVVITENAVKWLTLLVPIISMFALILIILNYTVLKIKKDKTQVKSGSTGQSGDSLKLLGSLYTNINRSLTKLQETKRQLTETEEELRSHLSESLELIEKEVSKKK